MAVSIRTSLNPNMTTRPSASDLISSSDDSDNYSSSALPKTSLKIPGGAPKLVTATPADDIDPSTNQLIAPGKYALIPKNSKIVYIKTSGKRIQSKFFKSYDQLADSILIGFYTHDKRNYVEKVANIAQLFVSNKTFIGAQSDGDLLKGTIELAADQWKSLNRDTIISYQKKDGDWVYRAKFNAFVKSPKDQTTRMSMTSEKGYSFVVNPSNIAKIYRHLSSNDKTLTFILQTLKQLDQRFGAVEKKVKQMDARISSIEQRVKRG
jgi:hypothetical protein